MKGKFKMKKSRSELTYSKVGFSGSEIAASYIAMDKASQSALSKINQVVSNYIDKKLAMADMVYIGNDFKDCLKSNGYTTKGKLGYFADNLKKGFKKQGYDITPVQKAGRYIKWTVSKLIEVETTEKVTESENTDNPHDSQSDGNGLDHDIIHDRLQSMLKSGVSPEYLIREILNQSVKATDQASYLQTIVDDVEQVPALMAS